VWNSFGVVFKLNLFHFKDSLIVRGYHTLQRIRLKRTFCSYQVACVAYLSYRLFAALLQRAKYSWRLRNLLASARSNLHP
jgi:hypothetical protein